MVGKSGLIRDISPASRSPKKQAHGHVGNDRVKTVETIV